jgi:hypothetical protein
MVIALTAILIAVTTLFSIPALAQVDTGIIAGTVTDTSGAVIPNANVTVTNTETNAKRATVTSATGNYTVVGLTPGTYQVSIGSGQFKSYTANVEVTVGSHVTLDAKLSISTAVTQVEVTAEGGNTVNTQTQELSQVVDTQQLAQLPSLTRNPYDFVALSGNVSSGDNTTNSSNSGQNLTSRGVGFSINGQRQTGTEILLDGVENTSIFALAVGEDVPVDSVQEYSVITNNFSAEYGRASGGVVNVTTKPGTNGFHGSAWGFNRLSAYTANTFANAATGAPKGTYTRNQFGYFVGGPILKDKLFVSQSTEWTRVRSNSVQVQEIFDPAFIAMMPANAQAYFASYGQGAPKPTGKVTTAGDLLNAGLKNVGPVNGVTPVDPTTPVWDTVTFNTPFDAGGGLPQNTYALVGRLDFTTSDKTQMFFRAGREYIDLFNGSQFYSAYPQYNVGRTYSNWSYLYSLAHTFSPSLVFSGKASYTRFNENDSFDTKQTYVPMLMFLTPSDPVTGNFIAMPGLFNLNIPGAGGEPVGGPQNTIQLEPDISWLKNRHSMRFGGTWTYIQLNYAYGAYVQAVEQLGTGTLSSMNNLLNVAGGTGGSQLRHFEARLDPQGKLPCHVNPGFWASNNTGTPDEPVDAISSPDCTITPPLGTPGFARSYRYNDWALYAQDSFKVTPKFTFNYGVRYEHYGVQHNNKPELDSNFYFGSGSGTYQQVRSGQVFIANKSPVGQFWAPSWGTVAPRVGFALDFGGNGITSLRGGYGISYERNFGNITYNASFNPPASQVLNSSCPAQVAGTPPPACASSVVVGNNSLGPLGAPGPPALLPPAQLRMPDPNIHVASTQFWSLALQRQLVPGTVAEISYSGAHGVHLYDLENINLIGAGQVYLGDPLTFASSPDCAAPCLNRPNNQYSNINMRGSLGSSAYNGLNVRIQAINIRKSGVNVIGNYTWAKALDNLSSTFGDSIQGGSGYIGSQGYTNFLDPGLDWGPADFDIRHRLSLSPMWATPWFKGQRGFAGQALGGWTASGIFTIRTGVPFSVYDYNNNYNGYQVPRLAPATPITNYRLTSSPQNVGPNLYNGLTVPLPASVDPFNPVLGISDFGPYPANMTRRNAFRGPGAWNYDMAVDKVFPLRERMNLEFRAEGFDIFNHHNFYTNTTNTAYFGGETAPLVVNLLKGGLGTLATGGNHDERRFGQFALKFNF